uniref:Uncharacterized protein n=1 Tax=Romanomermis culicivorax TaxID=13658 RepID=A0A915KG62_ROMCU
MENIVKICDISKHKSQNKNLLVQYDAATVRQQRHDFEQGVSPKIRIIRGCSFIFDESGQKTSIFAYVDAVIIIQLATRQNDTKQQKPYQFRAKNRQPTKNVDSSTAPLNLSSRGAAKTLRTALTSGGSARLDLAQTVGWLLRHMF